MKPNIKVAPSILSCDFAHLYDELKKLEKAEADAIHIDVMDGHFVKNITIGPKIVSAIKRSTDLFLDVHLMIYSPFEYVESFVESGADSITFHLEATEDIEDTINYIKKCNKKVGLAINPETSSSLILKYLNDCDKILFMSVNPGFGGQKFISKILQKIEVVKKIKDDQNLNFDIAIDGGINDQTAVLAKKAGVNYLVSGTYLFSQKNMKEGIETLKNC